MNIGFIGNSRFIPRILPVLQHKHHKVCGIYNPQDVPLPEGLVKYSRAETLISSADILYIAEDELPLEKISEMAVKDTKAIFFESPFILDYERFSNLYQLANESKSIIRLSQPLQSHPVYKYVKAQLNPSLIHFRVDSYELYTNITNLRQVLFDILSIIQNVVPSRYRKISYRPVQDYHAPNQGACTFDMDFDNGSNVRILINYLTQQEHLQAEFIQRSQRFILDFTEACLWIYGPEKDKSGSVTGIEEIQRPLVIEDFIRFIGDLNSSRLPLTINEDNQEVLAYTYSFLHEMQHQVDLLT